MIESAIELARLIRKRAISPVEIVEAHLCRIEQFNPQLNSIVTLAPDALEKARMAEAALMKRARAGLLHGVPITIKDTIETKNLRTTFGSSIRVDYVPTHDAPSVALLRRARAILLGKTNVSEMAIELVTDNPVFGRTNNPYNLKRTPGGSSGGEAAAISAGLSAAGLGSDLAGSIRMPAHCCGIVGLKPTSGVVPGGGHLPPIAGPFALGASIGPMARRVEDVAFLLQALSTSGSSNIVETSSGWEWKREDLRGNRVAWCTDDGVVPVTSETKQAVEAAANALGEAGMIVIEERPSCISCGPSLWFSLFAGPTVDFLRDIYTGRENEAGPAVRAMLTAEKRDTQMQDDEYQKAFDERQLLRAKLLEWMEQTSLIVAPVGAVPAFEHGTRRITLDDKTFGTFRAFSYSQVFNVFGLPSVSVPAGRSADGMPIGVQIIGRPFCENEILSAAFIIEQALGGWQPPANLYSHDERNSL